MCKCKNKELVNLWYEYDAVEIDFECSKCSKESSIELDAVSNDACHCSKCDSEDVVVFSTDVYLEQGKYSVESSVLCLNCENIFRADFKQK